LPLQDEKLTPKLVVVKVALPERELNTPLCPAARPEKVTVGFPFKVPGKISSCPSVGGAVKATANEEDVTSATKLAVWILSVPSCTVVEPL
jgi:hypothetical protein